MSDLSDFSNTKAADSELQDFLMVEKQKAQFHAQIHEFNDFCWEKCVDKPGSKLDSRLRPALQTALRDLLMFHFLSQIGLHKCWRKVEVCIENIGEKYAYKCLV